MLLAFAHRKCPHRKPRGPLCPAEIADRFGWAVVTYHGWYLTCSSVVRPTIFLSHLRSKGDSILVGHDLSQATTRKIVAGWSMPVGSRSPRPPPGEPCPGISCRGKVLRELPRHVEPHNPISHCTGIASAGGSDQYASNCPYSTINNEDECCCSAGQSEPVGQLALKSRKLRKKMR